MADASDELRKGNRGQIHMKSLRRRRESEGDEEEKPKGRGIMCGANGCPMAGTISGSTHPSDGAFWLCRYHFGKPADEWDGVTREVRSMSHEERYPPLKFQPLNIEAKKLRFAQPGREWAAKIIERERIGQYGYAYGLDLANSVISQQASGD